MGAGRESAWLRLARVFRGSEPVAAPSLLEPTPDLARPAQPILEQLDEIEAVALGVYASHGLPTQVGQYARSPENPRWKFIGRSLSAEERWALTLELGSTKGWRFCSLEGIGLEEGQPATALSQASLMLSACRRLRQSLGAGAGARQAEDIQTALRLGADWKQAELMVARQTAGSLKLRKIDAPAAVAPADVSKPTAAKIAKPRTPRVQPEAKLRPASDAPTPPKARTVRTRARK